MATTANNGDITHNVCQAIERGYDATMNALIQNAPPILTRISPTPFGETPLHISALLGRLDFTRALLGLNPSLAAELDSFGRSPLHLASAEGHTEVVRELLQVPTDPDVCLVADQQGRIPLHLAAMRGRVEVIQELVRAKPRSVLELSNEGDTVLHFCVRYNHLDALKRLVVSVKALKLADASVDVEAFLNLKNSEGNTILELSAKLKQLETFRYLLSEPQVRVGVNSLMIRIIYFIPCLFGGRNQSLPQSEWLEELRGYLMVAATVFATMCFQAGLNVPGGYWQVDTNKTQDGCPKGLTCKAGTSIISYTQPKYYKWFTYVNMLALFSSFAVILGLILGFPLKNNYSVRVLAIYMVVVIDLSMLVYFLLVRSVSNPHAI